MRYTYYTCSHKGKRARNEDDFFPHPKQQHNNLFFVCDGLGGHGDGDIASAFVQQNLPLELNRSAEKNTDVLNDAILKTHHNLCRYALQAGNLKMGSTVAALQFYKNNAFVGWVGDSRIYHIRNGRVLGKTKDHSIYQLMIDNGQIMNEEIIDPSLKNVIYQALGSDGKRIKPSNYVAENVAVGDVFVLATDGVFEALNEEELIMISAKTGQSKMDEIRELCELKSTDNFTCMLIEVQE